VKHKRLLAAIIAGLLPGLVFCVPAALAAPRLPQALVLSATASPAQVPSGGGTATIQGRVKNATHCRLKLLSHQMFPVVYASNIRRCRGSFTAHVTIGANENTIRRTIAFALVASNASSSFTGYVYLDLAPLPAPAILSVGAAPQQLGPYGGTTRVSARIEHAKTCQLHLLSQQAFDVVYATNLRPCRDVFTAHISVGANSSRVHRTIAFSLVTHAGKSSFTGYFYIGMAANSTAPAPTTTVPPAATTTVPPAPATTTTPGSSVGYYSQQSPNWSGYALAGGPLTIVQGTFTIPQLTSDATCNEAVGEWVGIDGQNASNLPTDTDLIQAGIGESMTNPETGACTADEFWFWAWWEILPAAATPVAISMSAGDSVTITIGLLDDGNYGIIIQDNSNGQEFAIEQPYYGAGGSVEWIVESPDDPALCGQGTDPSQIAGICPLAAISPVDWTDLKFVGTASALYQISMVQDDDQVATPTALDNGTFEVDYTGTNGDVVTPGHMLGRDSAGKFKFPIYNERRV
jgi:Peptidase A4 family